MSVTKYVRSKNGKRNLYYRAQVYVDGVRIADRIFDTKTSAHLWHDQEKEKYESGLRGEQSLSREMSFDECVDRFLEERFSRLELSTQQSRSLKLPYLRNCPLSRLKLAHLNARAIDLWVAWLLKHDSAKSPKRKSFSDELKFLNSILNWYRNYLDADYVVPITKRHRELVRYKKVKPRRPDYFARPEEVRAWVGWLKGHRNPVYYRLATFLMLTGTRIGEAAGLHWEDVDLKNRVARVVRIVAWDQRTKLPRLEERTKTESSVRILVLPEALVRVLEEMKHESGGIGLVFRGRDGDLLKYNAVQQAFNAGFQALNLPWRSTHICRHTYATLALMATRDLASVQASLGHSSIKVTEKYAKNVALLESGTAEKTAALLNL